MARTMIQIGLAVILIVAGWVAGRAQSPAPAFELLVDAPEGQTTIKCISGCELAWVERGVNPNYKATPTFTYSCKGTPRCSSGGVGGWLINR
jgi:hypothetical protein